MLNEGLEVLADKDGFGIFQNTEIEEITLPSTLMKIGKLTFTRCSSLKTVYVKRGCQANFSGLNMPSTV